MKNKHKSAIIVSFVIIVVALLAVSLLLLRPNDISSSPVPAIPTAIYSGTVYTSTSQLLNGQGQPTTAGLVNSGSSWSSADVGYIATYNLADYQLYQASGTNFQQLIESDITATLYVGTNSSNAGQASNEDLSQISYINSSIANDKQNAASNPNSAWPSKVAADQVLQSIILSSIRYNNALQSAPTTIPTTVTTSISGAPTTQGTTTISGSGSTIPQQTQPGSTTIASGGTGGTGGASTTISQMGQSPTQTLQQFTLTDWLLVGVIGAILIAVMALAFLRKK